MTEHPDDTLFAESDATTALGPDEREGLKLPHVETRGELDQVEQQNMQDCYRWLEKQRKYKGTDFLTEDFLLVLHRHMFGTVWRWAGHYRNSEKSIGIYPGEIAAALRVLLEDAQYWAEHDTYSREEYAARFHHRLVCIHPFPNGNGRHGRIMTDVVLENVLNVDPVDWTGEETMDAETHRQCYIQALRAADGRNYSALITLMS